MIVACVCVGKSLSNSNCTLCKSRVLKYAHRTVPNNSLCALYSVGKEFLCLCADVKIMIFSDDYTNLAVYEGNPMKNPFVDIVDIKSRGVSKLN